MTHSDLLKPVAVEISDLGSRLKSYRLSRNLSQEHVAQQAGITRKTLTNFEAGKGASLDTLIRVLRALDLGGRVDLLIPSVEVNPLDKVVHRQRQRASSVKDHAPEPSVWKWGD